MKPEPGCAGLWRSDELNGVGNFFGEPYTKWIIVFDIRRRDVQFRTAANPSVRKLSLGSFDFSCEAPLRMLDVNAELEGSADGYFEVYDHDENFETFRTGCKKLESRFQRKLL